jgi:hypothetical protein
MGGAACRTTHLIGRIGTHLDLPVSDAAIIFASSICYRHLVNLVPVRIYDTHELAAPIPPRHNRAMFEIACYRQRVIVSRSVARYVNPFVIVENMSAVGEVKIIARHEQNSASRTRQVWQMSSTAVNAGLHAKTGFLPASRPLT